MRSYVVVALVLSASLRVLCAQDAGRRVEIPRSDLSKYLRNCSVKAEADVQQEIKRQADRTEMVEKVLDFAIIVITDDEGGKAEQEGVSALLKKAKTGATLVGYWDNLMSWWTKTSKAQTFDVCEPLPGTIVVKPLQGTLSSTPVGGLVGAPPQLSFDDLMKQTTFATQCWSPSATRAFQQRPYVSGRVVEMTILGAASTIPVPSQWVSIAARGYQRGCSTNPAGEFSFSGLPPSSYTLAIGSAVVDILTVNAQSDLNLGDMGMPVQH